MLGACCCCISTAIPLNCWARPYCSWIPQGCECWEAAHFGTTVLGGRCQGTRMEIGVGSLGPRDPDKILTLVHTTSKPCSKHSFSLCRHHCLHFYNLASAGSLEFVDHAALQDVLGAWCVGSPFLPVHTTSKPCHAPCTQA